MAVFQAHNRLQLLGEFRVGATVADIWTCTLNFGAATQPNGTLDVASEDHMAAIDAALDTFWTSGNPAWKSWVSNGVALVGYKWNRIATTGDYLDPNNPHTRIFPTAKMGAGGNPYQGPQVAIVGTLVTASDTPTRRGRIYLPCDASNPSTSWRMGAGIPASSASLIAGLLGGLNTGLNSDGLAGGVAVVASSKGYNTHVTGVKVGDVFDTQRRRRNRIVESYSDLVPVGLPG